MPSPGLCRVGGPTPGVERIPGIGPRHKRHAFAPLLIAKRLNVVFVSCQLGHASPAITLRVCAHLFEQADHAAAARDALEASYAAMASGTGAWPMPVSAGST